jgi:signal transduction histidine kinase
LGVFFLGGVITYQVVKKEIDEEQQRFLLERLDFFTSWIERHEPTEAFIRDKIQVYPLQGKLTEIDIEFSDTVVMHSTLERLEPHIKLDVTKEIKGKFYRISMYDLIVEQDDIVESVRESMIKFYLLLTVIMLIVGGIASMYLFRPFNKTLDSIKDFRVDQGSPLKFQKTGTIEFNRLNSFVEEMTKKIQRDFKSLREFTENASHEMQTPLTNAIGKLEILLSSGDLNEENTCKVIATLGSLKHLSRMGQSLNLLTKIDNREFENIEKVNFSEMLETALENFKELIDLKSISMETDHQTDVRISMDPTLTTVLINNLLSNAIRHNHENGFIRTFLDQERFVISNSGPELTIDPNSLFDRFRKDKQRSDGLGLGLAIVKRICDYSGFEIKYSYGNHEHQLEISFKDETS